MRRRSFGSGGGGMGGGGAGSMLRAVRRAVRTGGGTVSGAAQEPFSHSTTKTATSTSHAFNNKASNASTALSLSSSSPLSILPLSAAVAALAPSIWYSSSDESEDWECLDDNNSSSILFDDYILGPVPSTDEVHHAVSALHQRVFVFTCL